MFKKILAFALAAVFCIAALASCDGGTETSDNSSATASNLGEPTTYTVAIKSVSGIALDGIDVYIYNDAALSDMNTFAKTDASGIANFNLPAGGEYYVVLANVQKGYEVASSYTFTGTNAFITLKSSLITDGELSSATIGLGDVMYDFTVMKTDGSEITLSEVLKEKKLVVLNFWYTTCSWCMEEFPIMDEVYEEYKDEVEIIALDPLDDAVAVEAFHKQYGFKFPMAACPSSWSATFGVQGYPTSVFIDRYGVVCLVESGAITSKRPFVSAFEHFTADEYKQKLCENGIGDLVSKIKPNQTMDTTENISALINNGDIQVTYRPETDDDSAEYSWPFVATEKLGEKCLYASNAGIDDSYAMIYADVTLKAGQAMGFDYLASSERLCDILYVIVDGEDVFQISGVDENESWKSCYPLVAEKDGTYEVALCFLKDSDTSEGDDTVYIKNVRAVNVADIDVDTYLPRNAGVEKEDGSFDYATVVFNEADNYYHVGTENGPLLLANLMNYSPFNEELSVFQIVSEGNADKDGVSLYDYEKDGGLGMVKYFSYASNSTLNGVCTVNKELGEMLKQVAEVAGFEGGENEWLKMCMYYETYGPNGTQLQDPIKGLSPSSAFLTLEGKNVETNYFYYDRAIIPRGLLSEFTPSKSGVYRFTSKSDYSDGIDAWIFNENGEVIYTYEHDERMYADDKNCSIVYYMEAGKSYYINMAFWDVYATGYIYYDVEYMGASVEHFRLAAPGYFSYDSDAEGNDIYDIIALGITPVLGDDGYYHDAEDGSIIYADFLGVTPIFGQCISQMIDMGGFDFSKSETDGEIIAYLKQNDNDVEKTREYLKTLWGDEYEANAEIYQLEDIFNGRYHGEGEDYTEEIRAYTEKIITNKDEREGCVAVDERLAELLQLLMDKYTFENVDNSWLKVCYYYDYLGPAK